MTSWDIITKNKRDLEKAIHCLNRLGYKYKVQGMKIKVYASSTEEMFRQVAKLQQCLKEGEK